MEYIQVAVHGKVISRDLFCRGDNLRNASRFEMITLGGHRFQSQGISGFHSLLVFCVFEVSLGDFSLKADLLCLKPNLDNELLGSVQHFDVADDDYTPVANNGSPVYLKSKKFRTAKNTSLFLGLDKSPGFQGNH